MAVSTEVGANFRGRNRYDTVVLGRLRTIYCGLRTMLWKVYPSRFGRPELAARSNLAKAKVVT